MKNFTTTPESIPFVGQTVRVTYPMSGWTTTGVVTGVKGTIAATVNVAWADVAMGNDELVLQANGTYQIGTFRHDTVLIEFAV